MNTSCLLNRTLPAVVGVALATLTTTACQAPDPTDPADPLVEEGRAGELTYEEPADPEQCAAIAKDASSLIASVMDCSTDAACGLVEGHVLLQDACLPTLACFVPVSEDVELAPVRAELARLDREYEQVCGTCPVPNCVDPDRLNAGCHASTCELTLAPPVVETYAAR